MPRYHLFGSEVENLMGLEKFGEVDCVTASQEFMDMLNESDGSSRRSDSMCSSGKFGDQSSPSHRGSNLDLTLLSDDGAAVEGESWFMTDRSRRPSRKKSKSLYNMNEITVKKKRSVSRRHSINFNKYAIQEHEVKSEGTDEVTSPSAAARCVTSCLGFLLTR